MALTIDLNGQTVDASSCKAKVYGNLTIQDSKGTGIIDAGSQGQAIEIKANASLTLKGGTIKTTGYGAVRTAGKSFFTMTGGVLEGAPAIQVIGGTLNITGGQVKAATNSYAAIESSSSAALTIGEAVSGTQTQEQAQKVYVASVNPQKGDVVFNSGVIGKVTGKFGPNALLSGWFESDITAQLPSGKNLQTHCGHQLLPGAGPGAARRSRPNRRGVVCNASGGNCRAEKRPDPDPAAGLQRRKDFVGKCIRRYH